VGVRLQDFEQQILDYLHAKHGAAAVEHADRQCRNAKWVRVVNPQLLHPGAADI